MFFNNLIPKDAFHVRGMLDLAASTSESPSGCCTRPIVTVYGISAVVFSAMNVSLYTLRGCYRLAVNVIYLQISTAFTELIVDLGNAALSVLSTAFGVIWVVVGLIYPAIYQKLSSHREGLSKVQTKLQQASQPTSPRNETTPTHASTLTSPSSVQVRLQLTNSDGKHPLDQMKIKVLKAIADEHAAEETAASPRKKNPEVQALLKSEEHYVQQIPPFVLSDTQTDRNTPAAHLRAEMRRLRQATVPKTVDFVAPEFEKIKVHLKELRGVNAPWHPLPDTWLDDHFKKQREGQQAKGKLLKEHILNAMDNDFQRPGKSSRRIDHTKTQGAIAAQTLSYLTTKRGLSEDQALEIISLLNQDAAAAQTTRLTQLFDSASGNRLTALFSVVSPNPHQVILIHFLDTTDETIQILFAHQHSIVRMFNDQMISNEPPLANITAYTWINYTQRKAFFNWKVDRT